jgi:hypothetical protein
MFYYSFVMQKAQLDKKWGVILDWITIALA